MFAVTLTKITETTVVYKGWFTTAEVKKNLKTWSAEYDVVEVRSAQMGVLEVTEAAQNG